MRANEIVGSLWFRSQNLTTFATACGPIRAALKLRQFQDPTGRCTAFRFSAGNHCRKRNTERWESLSSAQRQRLHVFFVI